MIITEMDRSECMKLLGEARLGRLACTRGDQPYVVPITYVCDGRDIYSFSLAGQKVDWMRANPNVCLQVDEFNRGGGWKSVVVNGRYEELPDRLGSKVARERAWSLLSQRAAWWQPGGLKPPQQALSEYLFYKIVIDTISGREARLEQ